MNQILADALEDFDQNIHDLEEDNLFYMVRDDEPHDMIWEITDSHVPIWDSELLELAARNNDLARVEPECGPAYDGAPTPLNIIAANVYEAISDHLFACWADMRIDLLEQQEERENAE